MSELRELQSKFVQMVGKLIDHAYSMDGVELTFGDAFAHDGHMKGSLHYERLAIDLNLFVLGEYKSDTESYRPLGEYWESIGGAWGGRFNDGNHFSLAYGGRK